MTRLSALFDLAGRRALVTGGSLGLGLVMARALGMQGATVHLAARSADQLSGAAAALSAEGIKGSVSPPYSPAARMRLDFEARSGLATSPSGLKVSEDVTVRA